MITFPPPFKITRLTRANWALEALRTAIHFDVFSKLEPEAKTAAQLAAAAGISDRGAELLLDALVSLEFLENKNGWYSLVEVSRLYLVADSKLFMGASIMDDSLHQDPWSNLSEVIRTGKPYFGVNRPDKAKTFFPELVSRIFPLNYGSAHSVANELKIEGYAAGSQVLDIAAGSGAWSLPLAERNKGIHVDALDFATVIGVTKRFAEKHGVLAQYSFIEGNWSDCKLAQEHYDIVLLGHILHSEGRKRSEALLKASHSCLKKGGRLVIAEMMADRGSPPSPFVSLFALNMLIQTDGGCVFSEDELDEMLKAQDFTQISRPKLPYWEHESPVIIAGK